jgi:hypothetical protein
MDRRPRPRRPSRRQRSSAPDTIDDGRWQAVADTPVDHGGDGVAELPGRGGRCRDRWLPVSVGAGGGQRSDPLAQASDEGVGRTAQADGAAIATEIPVDARAPWDHDGEGPGPEATGQATGQRRQPVGTGQGVGLADVGHEHRELHVVGTASGRRGRRWPRATGGRRPGRRRCRWGWPRSPRPPRSRCRRPPARRHRILTPGAASHRATGHVRMRSRPARSGRTATSR